MAMTEARGGALPRRSETSSYGRSALIGPVRTTHMEVVCLPWSI
jgi:hypothetical protein